MRWAFWSAVLGTAGFLAACGTTQAGTAPTNVEVVSAAPRAMAKVRSCRITATFSYEGFPASAETGIVDFADHRFMLTANGPTGPGGKPAQTVEVAVGDTMYLNGPHVGALSDPAKPWIEIPLTGKFTGFNLANADPTASLSVLANRAPVEVIGREEIRGVATTHFRQHQAIGGKPAQQDIWVDGKGLVRRLAISGDSGPPMSRFTSDAEFYDFGTSASVSVPPPSQVQAAPSSTGAATTSP